MGRFRLQGIHYIQPQGVFMEFNVPDISCGHCVRAVTEAVKLADPDAQVSVDLDSKKVTVQTTREREAVAAALAEAGYPVQ
jgi:copper chaperone